MHRDRFDEKSAEGCSLSDRELARVVAAKLGICMVEIPKEVFKVILYSTTKQPSRLTGIQVYYEDGTAEDFGVKRDAEGVYIERSLIPHEEGARAGT